MCLFWILSNKLDLNQETHFIIQQMPYSKHKVQIGHIQACLMHWSYDQIILLARFAGNVYLNKDAGVVIWS